MEQTEKEFLANYDPGKYPRPSVTADIVALNMDGTGTRLQALLIQRGGHPYKDKWALPGGFLEAGRESAEQAAARELKEETSLTDVRLQQLATFSRPDRDPRTHVISVAYIALIPCPSNRFMAGDDAAAAELVDVWLSDTGRLGLSRNESGGGMIDPDDLAFDHAEIITTALQRLRGRATYEHDAFWLLNDRERFTLSEIQRIHEALRGEDLDPSNFRKWFRKTYINTGIVSPTGETEKLPGAPAARLYRYNAH